MDTPISRKKIKKFRRKKKIELKTKKSRICPILKAHSEEQKSDPEHLRTNFLLQIILKHDQLFNEIVRSISANQNHIVLQSDFLENFCEMDPSFQKKIIEICGQKKNSIAIQLLGKVLSSKFQENQLSATQILIDIGTEEALEQLMLGYHISHVHPFIQSSFKQRGLIGIESLIHFAQHRNPMIRFNSMIALGEMGDDAVNPLKKCLSDNDVLLRRIAANALGDIGSTHSLIQLLKSENDTDNEVKKRSLESVNMIIKNLSSQEIFELLTSGNHSK